MARRLWLVPSLMSGGVILGIMTAVAHHIVYQSLHGQIVSSDSQQQWFLRIGTGLAFVTKTLLTTSAAMAYTQLLWHTLASRPTSLHGIDSMFGAVTNLWHITTWELWQRGPVLAILALIIWLVPFIAIVTPATLTVQPAAQPKQTTYYQQLPVLDYGTPGDQKWGLTGLDGYSVPSPRVVRIVSSVASQGSILRIPGPYPNCTFSTSFYAPSLSCGPPANSSLQDTFSNAMNARCPGGYCAGDSIMYVYFIPRASGDSLGSLNDTLDNFPTTGRTSGQTVDGAAFYAGVPDIYSGGNAMRLIQCDLYNTSYTANFTYTNGEQNITVTNMTRLEHVKFNDDDILCAQDGTPCRGPLLAYEAVLDALGTLFVGYLQASHYGVLVPIRTQIMSSVLMDTIEMQTLEKQTLEWNYTNTVENLSIANMSFSKALEEIMVNTTLSFLGESYFLQKPSSAATGPVYVFTPQNVYSYSPSNLIIAYGVGILFAVVMVIVGLVCILTSGKSFNSSFSAILRTTRNHELDEIVPAEERDGAMPLSKTLGRTRVLLLRQAHDMGMHTAFTVVGDIGDSRASSKSGGVSSRW